MNCPVCGTYLGDERSCGNCGFAHPMGTFLSQEDAQRWYDRQVAPVKTGWDRARATLVVCEKCGGGWTPPPGRQMTDCPFCSAGTPSADKNKPTSKISVGSKIRFGNFVWRVLSMIDGAMLVVSDRVILRSAFHRLESDAIRPGMETDALLEALSVSWETSDLRAYLNGEFLESFDSSARERILNLPMPYPQNPAVIGPRRSPLHDRVFLPGIDDVLHWFGGGTGRITLRKEEYTLDESGLKAADSASGIPVRFEDYVVDDANNPKRMAIDAEGNPSGWWLRSQGYNTHLIAYVDASGCVVVNGTFGAALSDADALKRGVRPAMWLKI